MLATYFNIKAKVDEQMCPSDIPLNVLNNCRQALKGILDGAEIIQYIRETMEEYSSGVYLPETMPSVEDITKVINACGCTTAFTCNLNTIKNNVPNEIANALISNQFKFALARTEATLESPNCNVFLSKVAPEDLSLYIQGMDAETTGAKYLLATFITGISMARYYLLVDEALNGYALNLPNLCWALASPITGWADKTIVDLVCLAVIAYNDYNNFIFTLDADFVSLRSAGSLVFSAATALQKVFPAFIKHEYSMYSDPGVSILLYAIKYAKEEASDSNAVNPPLNIVCRADLAERGNGHLYRDIKVVHTVTHALFPAVVHGIKLSYSTHVLPYLTGTDELGMFCYLFPSTRKTRDALSRILGITPPSPLDVLPPESMELYDVECTEFPLAVRDSLISTAVFAGMVDILPYLDGTVPSNRDVPLDELFYKFWG